jgi:hypothetical protein
VFFLGSCALCDSVCVHAWLPGPNYPSRVVRHTAKATMDAIFPVRFSGRSEYWLCMGGGGGGNAVVVWCSRSMSSHACARVTGPQNGRKVRAVISVLFRLLHPSYWPSSFLHWCRSRLFVKQLALNCYRRPKVRVVRAALTVLDYVPLPRVLTDPARRWFRAWVAPP